MPWRSPLQERNTRRGLLVQRVPRSGTGRVRWRRRQAGPTPPACLRQFVRHGHERDPPAAASRAAAMTSQALRSRTRSGLSFPMPGWGLLSGPAVTSGLRLRRSPAVRLKKGRDFMREIAIMAKPDVSALGPDRQLRARNASGKPAGGGGGAEKVVLAGQYARRNRYVLVGSGRGCAGPEAVGTQSRGLAADWHQAGEYQLGAALLIGADLLEKCGVGRQKRADHLSGRERGRGPEREIGAQNEIDGAPLQGGEFNRIAAGQVRRRHQQNKTRAPVGMAKGDRGRGEGARRSPDDGQALDSEMIEQFHENIGLTSGRCILGKGAFQIAEARWRDDLKALSAQPVGEQKPLIEAAPGTVDHHEWRSVPRDGVFQRARRGVEYAAAPLEPRVGSGHGGAVGATGPGATRQDEGADAGEKRAPGDHGTASIARSASAASSAGTRSELSSTTPASVLIWNATVTP